MYDAVDFGTVNPIPNPNVQVISSFHTRVNQFTGEPYMMVLNAAIDKEKANCDCCDFPIYVPAGRNYNSPEHLKMLELFQTGAPLVPVQCHNFILRHYIENGRYKYFAHADSFTVIDYDRIMEV